MTSSVRRWLAGSLSVSALILVGCGDDGSSSGSGTSTAPTGTGGSGGTATGGSGGSGGEGGAGGGMGGSYEGVDPLAGTGPPELIQDGFGFTEGTVWLADLGVLRFSDIPGNRIHELDPTTDTITVWREPSANTNGNGVLPNGEMVMCEHSGRRVSRSPASGAPSPTTVADSFEGGTFNSPNDVIARSDGTLYITDPTYGLQGPPDIPFRGVYRIAPDGTVTLVDDMLTQPNGIALSPDESTLYVSDSEAGGLHAYAVAADGSTGPPSVLIDAAPSDGMAIDDGGNLYLTTAAGIEVYDAAGVAWGTISVPEQPANCAFGGADRRTLYITAREGLYRVQLNIPGLP